MKRSIIATLLIIASMPSNAQNTDTDLSNRIVNLEKAALVRWNKGDPGGFIDISADDVVYIDPYVEKHVDGLVALKNYYEPIRGQVKVDKYEMLNPKVQSGTDMAVLTFQLFSYAGNVITKWNCTEVYRLQKGGQWKIVQTHWSLIKPELK